MKNDGKYVVAIAPAAIVDDATATATEIDTDGAHYLEVVIQLGATDIAATACKLQHSDTSGSGFADVTGATFDGGTDVDGGTLALPSATDDNQTLAFQVNLDGLKRYFQVVFTNGNGTSGGYVAAVARLSCQSFVEYESTSIADGGVCRI